MFSNVPISSLHCRSRLVHWPLAQMRPVVLPQLWPFGRNWSAGQLPDVPLHFSVKSQGPELARQTLFEGANLQPEQHSSFISSQTEPFVNLQVAPSQQVSLPHPCVPPQSHSSPLSTTPLPHWLPVIVTIPRSLTKQLELTLLRPKAEQMFPTVQGENCVIPSAVLGFMMY